MKKLSRVVRRHDKERAAVIADEDRKTQAILERQSDNFNALFRQAMTSDFPMRMRNQLALDLLDDENVIDDEPVLIFRGESVGVDAAGSALPRIGIVIATNHRIRFATVDDSHVEDAPLDTVRLTHDEDGVLTLTWSAEEGQREAATIEFKNGRAALIKQLRRLILEPDKRVALGPATPRVTTWDRIRRQRHR